ncbi:hypothetical protein [Nitrospirillum sp. BR 11163]|uniref:hypothetical protein n=1 Tax=Nitrospirillum sp. BR 11163 TaxID=3104323 RepID=UPI002AFFC9B3|nr:hypothetical protein [Nitrospirillum sp. BR 11163]MEA1677337.1 hypothetical protein [Nitrospirillum sp. BR 11163]
MPEQLSGLVDHLHELLLRVVNAVRTTQLDVRDLRDQVKGGLPALPPPAPNAKTGEGAAAPVKAADTGAVQALAGRLEAVEESCAGRRHRPRRTGPTAAPPAWPPCCSAPGPA